ncbi:MAG: ribonuclease Z [bacterium]
MELTVLGSGGFMPYPGLNVPGFIVRRRGTSYLLDAGEGSQLRMVEEGLARTDLEGIFISHMHGDHTLGLPGVLIRRGQENSEEPLRVLGPEKLEDYIYSTRRTLGYNVHYEINYEKVFNGAKYKFSEIEVVVRELDHRSEAYGYVLKALREKRKFHPEKARELNIPQGPLWGKLQKDNEIELEDGRVIQPEQVSDPPPDGPKLVYITDTRPILKYPEEFYNPDILIHEGMFLEKHKDHARKKKHSTALEAARVASHLEADKLLLTHRSRRYMQPEQLVKEAEKEFSSVELAHDGMQLDF